MYNLSSGFATTFWDFMTILNVSNLNVTFDDLKVLDDISFSLNEGQYLAIVGPNGAGKSTLVRTLVKEITHYKGSFSFSSQVKNIGYLAQQNNDGSYFPATAFEVIKSGMSSRNIFPCISSNQKVFLDKIIRELEIETLLNKPFFNLSGGQKRIVLLARALATSQKFLILDEPASGLDANASSKLYESIIHVNKKFNTAIMMISHDLEKVISQASSVLCIEHKTKFFGSSKDFIQTNTYKELLEHNV